MNPTLRSVTATATAACRCSASRAASRRTLATVVSAPNAGASTSSSSSSASTASSSGWKRPIPEGRVPAYDEALAYLRDHSQRTREQADALQARLEKEGVDLKDSKSDAVRELDALRVAAEINLPEVLWEFQNGQGDLSRPVHRHLRERVWRQEGALEKMIERVRLQYVIPDVLPRIEPTVDLQIFVGDGSGIGDHGGEGGEVLAGVMIPPHKTMQAPHIVATPFHTEERLYTLLMVDPDMPVPETESYAAFAHWLVTDIPLSFTRNTFTPDVLANATLPYLPPHPAQGSAKHRYVTLLFEQKGRTGSSAPDLARAPFDVRSYLATHAADPDAHTGGLHFFRSQWTKEPADRRAVSRVWAEQRGLPEPAYGTPPRVDRHEDEAGERPSRYF